MSLKSKIIGAVGKKAVKTVAKNIMKNSGESSNGGAIAKTTNFFKQASKAISVSDVVEIARMATGTSAVMGATMFAGQTVLDAKNTTDILSKEFEQLRTIFRRSVTLAVQSLVTSVARNPIEL